MKRHQHRMNNLSKRDHKLLPVMCSLADHIEDADHPRIQRELIALQESVSHLPSNSRLTLLSLLDRLHQHILYEQHYLFPEIRLWAKCGKLSLAQKRKLRDCLYSDFSSELKILLSELKNLQEELSDEKTISEIDKLEEGLCFYANNEDNFLMPIIWQELH